MLTIARRRARPHLCFLLLTTLAACNNSGNNFPNEPGPTDTQTGTTTPTTDPPTTIPQPPPTPPPTGTDTEAPRVQMLLPAANAALTGTTPIVADASDNVAVSSVQFLVDNKLLGPPDLVSPYWLQFDTSYLSDGGHSFSARASDAAGNQATASARKVTISNDCKTASLALTPWQNTNFNSGGNSFTIQWDATPLEAGLDAAVGLSRDNATGFASLATEVHFNLNNTIDVRSDGAYAALATISYQPGQTFHVRMNVNIASHTYSVFVAPLGGTEQALAIDFAFRTEQQTVSGLNRWVVGTQKGALKVCSASVAGNKVPVAKAGSDQKVTEGATVVLDGSASSDPDGTIVAYQWRQTAGTSVVLSGATSAVASFTAPSALLSTALEFQLTVTDDRGATASDRVRITVEAATTTPNSAPTANAGPDLGFDPDPAIFGGTSVSLNGDGSDPDVGDQVTDYNWTQVDGTSFGVTLPAHQRIVTFVAPVVPTDTTLVFQLTVTDTHGATGSDTVNVLVRSSATNQAPVANAGPDRLDMPGGMLVTLTRSATDPDSDAIVSYARAETPVATVVLVPTADPATVTFTAPQTAAALTFMLTATDARGASASDSVNVTVAALTRGPI